MLEAECWTPKIRTSTVDKFSTKSQTQQTSSYFDKVLELFILLLELFEDADGFGVMAAELSIQLLHLLCIFTGELEMGSLQAS